jgi:hypothetical protein
MNRPAKANTNHVYANHKSTPSDACMCTFHFTMATRSATSGCHLPADTIDLSLGWADVDAAAGEASHAAVNTVEGARSVAVEHDVGDAQVIRVVGDILHAAVHGEDLAVPGVGSGLELDIDVLDGAGLVLEGEIGEGGEGGGEEGDGNGGDGDGLHFGWWECVRLEGSRVCGVDCDA